MSREERATDLSFFCFSHLNIDGIIDRKKKIVRRMRLFDYLSCMSHVRIEIRC